jgi:hypothetical protein
MESLDIVYSEPRSRWKLIWKLCLAHSQTKESMLRDVGTMLLCCQVEALTCERVMTRAALIGTSKLTDMHATVWPRSGIQSSIIETEQDSAKTRRLCLSGSHYHHRFYHDGTV